MNRHMHNLKHDNNGMSLVELIISFAILGFITLALMGFMSSGMRFFRNNTAYIGLQYEYQSVMTHMREYILDCNAGMVADDTDALYIVYSENIMHDHDDNPSTPDEPAIRFTTHIYFFDAGTLYYQRAESIDILNPAITTPEYPDGPPDVTPATAGASVLSNRVTGFIPDINLSDSTGRATVRTDISFLSINREYRATQDIAARNMVTVAEPPSTPGGIPVKFTTYAELQAALTP